MIRSSIVLIAGALLTAGLFTAGCATQQPMSASYSAELDSMYAENRGLQERMRVLRDSLQFYDDIDSGQYYRDRRILEQEINRLEYELAVCADGGESLQTMLVDELFEPASANLKPAGLGYLAGIADTLSALPEAYRIRVEAHSDSTPIGGSLQETYPSNWELSAARAAAVVRHLVDEYALSADRFEVVSFGMTQPVATNATANGRRENRRIEITTIPR